VVDGTSNLPIRVKATESSSANGLNLAV